MSSSRANLLSRCTLSDRDCLARGAQSWPRVGYSCDFCDTWPRVVGRCRQCRRWLGLSECDCAAATLSSSEFVADSSEEEQQIVDSSALCRWCATGAADVPVPCGRTFGLLRRVVFVLEPAESDRWRFRVAARLAESVLEAVGRGTVLVYGIESGSSERDWTGAMAAVGRCARSPAAHLPADCVLDPDVPLRVSVVLATHSMQRLHDRDALRLELADGESRPFDWWCRRIADEMLQPAHQSPARITDLYLVSCRMFPRGGGAAAANARALGALADRFGVAVMACNGEPPVFQQIGLMASYIIASSSQPRREPKIACDMRRFQPNGSTLAIEPQPVRLVVEAYHETAIDGLVSALTKPAAAAAGVSVNRGDQQDVHFSRVDARERAALLRCTDAELARQAFVQSWPFGPRGRWTVTRYRQAFHCAAAARGLLSHSGAQHATLIGLVAGGGGKERTVARQLAFLVERLGRDGVLDTAPGNGVQWSLERAIVTGLVEPPTMRFLWYELDAKLFDTSLAALRCAWARMEAPLRKRRR